jgi:hypothetical protein
MVQPPEPIVISVPLAYACRMLGSTSSVTQVGREEVILPYPSNPVATRFRSTWLTTSLKSLRQRNLLDRYLGLLPRRHHDAVIHSAVGDWLSIEVAMAHYEAMEQLGLSDIEIMAIGGEVTERFHGLLFSTVLRLARTAGVTPWSVLGQTQKMWDKTWIGGGIAVWKIGPREARGEIVGWPCSRFHYCRVAMRGVMMGTVSLFCRKAWAQEIPERCTDQSLVYKLTWVY